MLEPLVENHQLGTLCERHGVALVAHDALGDALATAALVRVLLERDLAPESAQLDLDAFMRLRPRGDTRPASDPQIRRVFALARVAGFTGADGRAHHNKICQLVQRVAGVDQPDVLTREQVQDVYDELNRLIRSAKKRRKRWSSSRKRLSTTINPRSSSESSRWWNRSARNISPVA